MSETLMTYRLSPSLQATAILSIWYNEGLA